MRLAGRLEPLLDADVELVVAHGEPDAATRAEQLGLLDLVHADQPSEQATSLLLALRSCSELYVIDSSDRHAGRP